MDTRLLLTFHSWNKISKRCRWRRHYSRLKIYCETATEVPNLRYSSFLLVLRAVVSSVLRWTRFYNLNFYAEQNRVRQGATEFKIPNLKKQAWRKQWSETREVHYDSSTILHANDALVTSEWFPSTEEQLNLLSTKVGHYFRDTRPL